MPATASDLARFNIPEIVTFEPGAGGLIKAVITAPTGKADVYLHGATIAHFRPEKSDPVLFLSKTSNFMPNKAIRGGVPVIFPWFGPHPTDKSQAQHGFVRMMEWSVASTSSNPDNTATLVLTIASSSETKKVWPYDFAIRFTIKVGDSLDMHFEVTNTGSTPFTYDEALHTYFNIPDIKTTQVEGLENTEFVDKVDGGKRVKQHGPVVFSGETDRVYLNTPATCTIKSGGKTIAKIAKEGSLATVVWNPGGTKAEAIADLAGNQWPGFCCVETVNALDNRITLQPGAKHAMRSVVSAG
jgi:glucose-6-phosphate 1-epimerase